MYAYVYAGMNMFTHVFSYIWIIFNLDLSLRKIQDISLLNSNALHYVTYQFLIFTPDMPETVLE